MDVNNADNRVVKRKYLRSYTASLVRVITEKTDDYNNATEERRTKSASSVIGIDDQGYSEDYGLLFSKSLPLCKTRQRSSSSRSNSFGSLKVVKQRRDCGLRSLFSQLEGPAKDEEILFKDDRKNSDASISDSTDVDILSFAAEDDLQLENSIRMSQLRAEKKVTFFAEALLHESIQRDDVDELSSLLRKHDHLNLEKPNSFGITPLHRAAIEGGYRCLNFLLSRNVNVKVRDMYGWTPLHDAVYHGHIRCAAALITAGSDVEAETNDFIKPIEIAPDDDMLLLIGRAMTSPGYVYDQDRETLV